MDSNELLAAYVNTGSGAAFTELVRRHINLVYSAALRKVGGEVHLARDVCQLVFTDLALKAQLLPARVVLAGWLHHHTCYRAATTVRGERRRRAREQEAATMKMINEISDENWSRLTPLIDDALESLPQRDRSALLLRYFEGKSLAETGQALGLSDDAAQKRVSRATEKLRAFFDRRGVSTASAALATVLTTNAVRAAPAGLEITTARLSLATAAAMPAGTAFVYKILAIFMKHKTTSALAGFAVITAIVVVMQSPKLNARSAPPQPGSSPAQSLAEKTLPANPPPPSNSDQPLPATENIIPDYSSAKEVIARMANTYATCRSYFDSGLVKTVFIEADKIWTTEKPFRTVFVRPDRFRFEFWTEIHDREPHFIVWSQGQDTRTWWDLQKPNTQSTTLMLGVASGTGISSSSAHTVPSLLLSDQIGGRKLTDLIDPTRGENEMVDGIDCIRIKGLFGNIPQTLWLDKNTLLVRRMYQEVDHGKFRTQETTSYSPVLNGAIPEELLQFDPPERPNAPAKTEQKK